MAGRRESTSRWIPCQRYPTLSPPPSRAAPGGLRVGGRRDAPPFGRLMVTAHSSPSWALSPPATSPPPAATRMPASSSDPSVRFLVAAWACSACSAAARRASNASFFCTAARSASAAAAEKPDGSSPSNALSCACSASLLAPSAGCSPRWRSARFSWPSVMYFGLSVPASRPSCGGDVCSGSGVGCGGEVCSGSGEGCRKCKLSASSMRPGDRGGKRSNTVGEGGRSLNAVESGDGWRGGSSRRWLSERSPASPST
mmetsp:Transcript_7724/g.25440  ORF Transcript_7724/g.25440 Transcript_7724/m.25440 type:complete len:256 (-) Transcript_7724:42-809(-)